MIDKHNIPYRAAAKAKKPWHSELSEEIPVYDQKVAKYMIIDEKPLPRNSYKRMPFSGVYLEEPKVQCGK